MRGRGKRGNGVAAGSAPPASSSPSIPAGSRKMVQSLKEIVNCSESEIYAMLKECNMDPSEAVQRLLTQDTFQEVKSKREKKKESKDIPEFKSRAMNNYSSYGARAGTDRGGHTSFNQSSSNDYGMVHGKPVHKKASGTNNILNTMIAGSGTAGSNFNQRSTMLCEAVSMQNNTQAPYIADGPPLPSQAPSGYQHNWSRMPGQMSMADIVKNGRPQGRLSSTAAVPTNTFNTSHWNQSVKPNPTTTPPSQFQEIHISQDPVSQDEEAIHELITTVGHHTPYNDWSLDVKAPIGTGSGSTHPEVSSAPVYDDPSGPSGLLAEEVNLERDDNLDENQVHGGDANSDDLQTESNASGSIYDGQTDPDNSGDSTQRDEEPLDDRGDDEEISSAAANFQQLNINKGIIDATPAADNPAVIIPSHLQVTNADCSHLSFGSFGAAANAKLSGPFTSESLSNNLEMPPAAEDTPSLDQLNTRNTEYYADDQLQSTTLNDSLAARTSTNTSTTIRSHDVSSASQPEILRDDTLEAAHGLQENFLSVSGYSFSATAQPAAAAYTYLDPISQMQNLSSYSSLMQSYSSSLPSSLLAPTVQPSREFDIPFAALLANEAVKYNAQTSSVSGASTQEVKQEVFSAPQLTPQALPSSSIPNAGSPSLPQHLMHPYSQPTLPLGHFANMIGYPFLPQSYSFLPSAAFPQAYTGSSPFQQSPAPSLKYSPLPQYKSGISLNSLPQPPALPSGYGGFTSSTNNILGYGGFTSSTNIPAGFSLNPSTSSAGSVGFEDSRSSQYKEGSHYLSLQHNENSPMWLQGASSRAASALTGNTFYGIQPHQNQQNGGYRQVQQQQQQPSQYGPMGYMNFYQSHGAAAAQEQQQLRSSINRTQGKGA